MSQPKTWSPGAIRQFAVTSVGITALVGSDTTEGTFYTVFIAYSGIATCSCEGAGGKRRKFGDMNLNTPETCCRHVIRLGIYNNERQSQDGVEPPQEPVETDEEFIKEATMSNIATVVTVKSPPKAGGKWGFVKMSDQPEDLFVGKEGLGFLLTRVGKAVEYVVTTGDKGPIVESAKDAPAGTPVVAVNPSTGGSDPTKEACILTSYAVDLVSAHKCSPEKAAGIIITIHQKIRAYVENGYGQPAPILNSPAAITDTNPFEGE